MNEVTRLEFDLTAYNVTVQHVIHDARQIAPLHTYTHAYTLIFTCIDIYDTSTSRYKVIHQYTTY